MNFLKTTGKYIMQAVSGVFIIALIIGMLADAAHTALIILKGLITLLPLAIITAIVKFIFKKTWAEAAVIIFVVLSCSSILLGIVALFM